MSERKRDPQLQCCIVQDHHHIVPFLQACWRSRKIPTEKLVLIHYDSHPDMAVLSTKCVGEESVWSSWSNMRTLVDRLEDVQGIAEFLLPLCDAGAFSNIVWRRPTLRSTDDADCKSWCSQFDNGTYRFSMVSGEAHNSTSNGMGLATTTVCVDLNHSYYLDEGDVLFDALGEVESYSKSRREGDHTVGAEASVHLDVITSLNNLRAPTLVSKEAASCDKVVGWTPTTDYSCGWVLDICLDYFSVQNPFRKELQCALRADPKTNSGAGKAMEERIDAAVTVICDMFLYFKFRNMDHSKERLRPAFSSLSTTPAVGTTSNSEGNKSDPRLQRCASVNKDNREFTMSILQQLLQGQAIADSSSNSEDAATEWPEIYRPPSALLVNDFLSLVMPTAKALQHAKRFVRLVTGCCFCNNSGRAVGGSLVSCDCSSLEGCSFSEDSKAWNPLSRKVRELVIKHNTLLLLPHHLSSAAEVVSMIREMAEELCHFKGVSGKEFCAKRVPPVVVTIARSAVDTSTTSSSAASSATDSAESNTGFFVTSSGVADINEGGSKRLKLSDAIPATTEDLQAVDDEFTPAEQVDFIQHCVLVMLRLILSHKVWELEVPTRESVSATHKAGDAASSDADDDVVKQFLADLNVELSCSLTLYEEWYRSSSPGRPPQWTESSPTESRAAPRGCADTTLMVHRFYEDENPVRAAYTVFLNKLALANCK